MYAYNDNAEVNGENYARAGGDRRNNPYVILEDYVLSIEWWVGFDMATENVEEEDDAYVMYEICPYCEEELYRCGCGKRSGEDE